MHQVELEVVAPVLGHPSSPCEVFADGAGVRRDGPIWSSESCSNDRRAEFEALCDFLVHLSACYGSHLVIRLLDPGSARGVWTSTRHRVCRYPTFIVDDRDRIAGFSRTEVDAAIRSHFLPQREQ